MKNGAWFPVFLVALLLVSVGSNIYLLYRATNDPAFAVEPDYYQKAVEWDDHQAEKAASERLGWHLALEAERAGLRVLLTDRLGQPIEDAHLQVVAFHNARAGHRLKGEMVAEGEGYYTWKPGFDRPGLWEYQLAAVRGEDRFLQVTKRDVP